jgi:hypothetical protein
VLLLEDVQSEPERALDVAAGPIKALPGLGLRLFVTVEGRGIPGLIAAQVPSRTDLLGNQMLAPPSDVPAQPKEAETNSAILAAVTP